MAAGDEVDTVIDERGDRLESVFWGGVFLFTVALFLWEFGLGAIHAGHVSLQPIGTITDFAQTMWISALVGGGGVVLLITIAVFRYSSGFSDEPAPLAPGQGSLKFAVFVLAVFAIVSTTIFVGASTLAQTDEANAAEAAEIHNVNREVEMSVTAAQWFWRFEVEGVPVTQGEHVVLPADTIVQFQTTSADVIHSFSIKGLGITKDAFPGQVNQGWFYVGHVDGETQLAFTGHNGTTHSVPADTYEVRCAELCGKGHSKMIATIYVVPPDHYTEWVEAKGGHADDAFSPPTAGIRVGNETAGGSGGHEESDGGHSESGGGHSESRTDVSTIPNHGTHEIALELRGER